MAFNDNLNNKDGLLIKPDGPFYADLLWDYLHTTVYKWESNHSRSLFLIEAFEHSPEELCDQLTSELHENGIMAELTLNQN